MGISPIAGIRAMPVVKIPPKESGLSKVFDVENSSAPRDDSYSGNGKKASGGQDDEAEELEDAAEGESGGQAEERGPGTQGNYFA